MRKIIDKKMAIGFLFVFTMCSIFSTPFPLFAAKVHSAAGSTSATFLKIGVGARAVSMAGAFTAVADDPYAVYWNPAGLVYSKGAKHLSFSHNEYFQGLAQEFMVYTLPSENIKFLGGGLLKGGVFGFGFNYFYTPKDMERRSGLNESDPIYPISVSEGTFRAYDAALSMSYGYSFSSEMNLGASLKFIRQSIDDESGSSFALDAGVLRHVTLVNREFMAGFTIQNLGPGIKFISERYDLPLTFKAGLSHRIVKSGTVVSLNIDKPIDNYPSFILGMEYHLTDKLSLNSGYKYRLYGNELGGFSGLATGIGFSFNDLLFSYSFSPSGDLGNSHILSLSFRFGKVEKPKPVQSREVVPAYKEIKDGKTLIYRIEPKVLAISSMGIRYFIKAQSDESDIYEIKFKTFMRGPAGVNITMIEGGLPSSLSDLLGSKDTAFKAFQFSSNLGNMQGKIDIDFRVRREETDKVKFNYLSGDKWESSEIKKLKEDEIYKYFSVNVPFSTHYLIAR
jgi:Type IX secretion system protein PorV